MVTLSVHDPEMKILSSIYNSSILYDETPGLLPTVLTIGLLAASPVQAEMMIERKVRSGFSI